MPIALDYRRHGRERYISNQQILIDVVAEAGLDRHQAEDVLASNDDLDAIKEAKALSRRLPVGGVPFFIVNGKITLGGAQPPAAFLEAFRQAVNSK